MKKNVIFPVIFTLVSFLTGTVLFLLGVFDFWENKIYDHRMNFAAKFTHPSDDICFIGVDQRSIDSALKEFGYSWPWPRSAYAKIIDYLSEGEASSVAFDVLFTEPSVYGREDDEKFALSSKNSDMTIQAMFVSPENEKALFPIPQIKNSASLIGNITSSKDSDDIIRRVRVSRNFDGKEYPFLAFAPLLLGEESVEEGINEIKSSIPLRKDETVLLRYYGSIDRYAHYSAFDILKSYDDYLNGREPLIPPENFEGSVVFFLLYAPGLYDICATPVSKVYPGSGVHITALDNYLQDDFIKEIPRTFTVLYLFFCSALASFLILILKRQSSYKLNLIFSCIFMVLGPVLIIFASYALFCKSIFIQIVSPVFCFLFSFLEAVFYSYATEGRQRRFIKTAFTQYLSPAVINELLKNPEKLTLGGEKRRISIFFSDVQSFTSISEHLEPEELTDLLNKYLSQMTSIILKNGGTIDKYEGDAIIAFWNAPCDTLNHERKIVETAVECQVMLKNLEDEFIKLAGRPLYTRIGLNTGYAVVGNMGSDKRFDYTMFGDSVNLASRLEGINKAFGTYTICSEETYVNAKKQGCDFYFRKLSDVKVVGKNQAVAIFEPVQKEFYEEHKSVFENFEKALKAFKNGDFVVAKDIFDLNKDDEPSKKYSEKCSFFIKNPPSAWNGIWEASSK